MQVIDAASAFCMGLGVPGNGLVSCGGHAVKAYFKFMGREISKQFNNGRPKTGPIGKHGCQDARLFRMGVDLFKIIAQQGFATRKKQVQAAGRGNLIDDRHPSVGAQLLALAGPRGERLPTKITMHTSQITAIGQRDATGNRDATLFQFAAERASEGPLHEGLGFRAVHVYATSRIKSASKSASMKSFKSIDACSAATSK